MDLKENSKWYDSTTTRIQAEKTMVVQPLVGAFLIRNTESSPDGFSLSVKFPNGVQHFKIFRDKEGKYFVWLIKFNSINELVEYYKKSSISTTQQIFLSYMIVIHPGYSVTAMYDFMGRHNGELTIKRGQNIVVLDKINHDWWRGRVGDQEGVFPVSFVCGKVKTS